MVKRLFLMLALGAVVSTASAQTQLTNGDFETWTYDGVNLPNNWNSFQTADGTYAKMGYSSSNRLVKQSDDTRPGSKGNYSCAIWSRSILGVVAQGNLTTGRVHAGSMTADNKDNYNYSDRDGSNTNNGVTNPCAMKFTGKPDSIVVWVKFVPAGNVTSYPNARFSAIIHDDHDYITYGLDSNDNDTNKGYVVAKAVKEFPSCDWTRVSLPFEYTSNKVEPSYIIFNASTNAYPGKGTSGDYLYIDDIECVYNTTYSEPLYVTVNGSTTGPQTANVVVSEYKDDFTFSLTKFTLTTEDGDVMPVGDIVVTGLTKDANGNFTFSGNITIQENVALTEEYGYCMGPLLGQIPAELTGQFKDGVVYVSIDIDMQDAIGQTINVHLGYDKANMAVSAAKYGTFVAPFDVTIPSGVTASTVTEAATSGLLTLSPISTTIPANTPVILNSESSVGQDFFGVAVAGTPDAGLLTGVYTDTPITSGYVLQKQGDKVGFYQVSGTKTIPANRAYLNTTSSVKGFYFEEATGIDRVENVEMQSEMYDLSGRRVKNATKGVYIINGKKVLK